MKLIDLKEYGPIHRFGDHHVYRTLSQLSDCKRRGRKSLANSIGIGEGSIRTILEFLRDKGFIEVRQTGIQITKSGSYFLEGIPLNVERLPSTDMSLSDDNVAVQVKGSANMVVSGIQQRDSAIKAGADGATTIVIKEGNLIIPPDYSLDLEQPVDAKVLRNLFDLKDGDVIIIGTAKDFDDAENGAVAAALDIL
jgi:DNA-binding transcriptional regulator LsrR (DeoR family)